METKLKYIQFDNGVELISEIDISDWKQAEAIRLINPLKLFVLPPFVDASAHSGVSGEQTMILIKWIPWVSNSITIKIDKLLVVEDIDQLMVDYYHTTLDKYTRMSMSGGEEGEEPEQEFNKLMDESFDSVEELTDLVDVLKTLTKKPKRVLH
jgi:hypothetical protein